MTQFFRPLLSFNSTYVIVGNVFYFNKIYLAFDLIDENKDHKLSMSEWEVCCTLSFPRCIDSAFQLDSCVL